MRIVMFYHSLVSDWNHGNAHFLRGVVTELQARGHAVTVYEPADAWSAVNLFAEYGETAFEQFHTTFPQLESICYIPATLDLDKALTGADLVLVHEWNQHDLVREVGEHRARAKSYRLLFHDTHHRSATDPESMAAYDLSNYDGVLAFGRVIQDLYLKRGWARQAWTWHEAADTRVFKPLRIPAGDANCPRLSNEAVGASFQSAVRNPQSAIEGDLVWIGNWGDEERTEELREFLIEPVKALKLRARMYGVRYPAAAQQMLADAGIEYAGWLPNYDVPKVFARYRLTVHVPRRPYTEALPGIPTIRVFEALACGIPLICAEWQDSEKLFTAGADYLVARDGREMQQHLQALLSNEAQASALAEHGLCTIRARHTCSQRVDELLRIYREL